MNNLRKAQQGFTLIELMIVVAIIAILAAIALPAYQDYLVKTRVSEVITAASSARTTISEAAAARTAIPATYSIQNQTSRYVSGVTYSAGVITAAGRALGGDTTDGQTITLTGTRQPSGQVSWICAGTIPSKYRPATCQGN